MRLARLRLCNFQSFGTQPVTVDLDRLTYLLGPNGAGKTAVLQALVRMFGVDRALRRTRTTDFHVTNAGGVAQVMWLEAEFELAEAGDDDAVHPTVPAFFNHMQLASSAGPACVRIRLTATLDIDGEIDEKIQHVLQVDDKGAPVKSYEMSRNDRRLVEVHYLPARRDPAEQLSYAATSLLGRALRAVDWSAQRAAVVDLAGKIDETLADSDAMVGLGAHLQEQWKTVYSGDLFSTAEVAFGERDLETVFRYLTLRFTPALSDERAELTLLSDGQKSLLYISLVLALHGLGRDVLAGKSSAFDANKLRPAAFTMIAVEEPENSLAPRYLGRISSALRQLVNGEDAQALIATHSPAMLRRVPPEHVRYLRLDADRRTSIRHITLPVNDTEARKFVREAVTAFPELYFARLAILGEGDSEEIVLPRLLAASGLAEDDASIAVVPLGGRHVNHMWRLLHGLDIPHVTLLDLDFARFGGGWGRITNALKQLRLFSEDPTVSAALTDEVLDELPKWDSDESIRTHGPPDTTWLAWLEEHAVYFAFPLDLDFAMLSAYPAAYGIDDVAALDDPDDEVLTAVLGKARCGAEKYGDAQRLFEPYQKRFKLSSKPVAHLTALSQLSDDELLDSMPKSLADLIGRAKMLIDELPE